MSASSSFLPVLASKLVLCRSPEYSLIPLQRRRWMDSLSPDGRARQRGWWVDCSLRFPCLGRVDAVHDLSCQVGPQVVAPQNWLPREWHTDPFGYGHHSNDRLLLRVYDRHSRCSRYLWRCVVAWYHFLPIY